MTVIGQGAEERIDGKLCTRPRSWRQPQGAVLEGQLGARWEHMDAIDVNPLAVARRLHGHGGCPRQDVDEVALVFRVEVVDDDDADARALAETPQ